MTIFGLSRRGFSIASALAAVGLSLAFIGSAQAQDKPAEPPTSSVSTPVPPAGSTAVATDAKPTAPDTKPSVTFGAFVDGYYAWDFDRPATFDRAYATQPARHAEFNVNLAFVEAKLEEPNVRGRLAVQYVSSGALYSSR